MKYLVIVESPAKKAKIQKFLSTIAGHQFIVEASFGHIYQFADGLKSIHKEDNYRVDYAPMTSIKIKREALKRLKELRRQVDEVIIATDPDREGEAIGFHLANYLGVNPATTKRIAFHEITQREVVKAFHEATTLNIHLYNAQQARSVLDLLIGFEISPILWRYVAADLSAGRCQSPCLRLLYDRHREIQAFQCKQSFHLSGQFQTTHSAGNSEKKIRMEADYIGAEDVFSAEVSARERMLDVLKSTMYRVSNIHEQDHTQNPPPPFTTSTIQQECSYRFKLSPKQTMGVLQKLYEKGKITYMRTDSVAISHQFVSQLEPIIAERYPGLGQRRVYQNRIANAQEAHECIRPIYADRPTLEMQQDDREEDHDAGDDASENGDHSQKSKKGSKVDSSLMSKVYEIIYKRTIASQMKPAIIFKQTTTLESMHTDDKLTHRFQGVQSSIKELGFKVVYQVSTADEENGDEGDHVESHNNTNHMLKLKVDDVVSLTKLTLQESYNSPPTCYTEASLVQRLEKEGIGRPSTFANIIETLFFYIRSLNSMG